MLFVFLAGTTVSWSATLRGTVQGPRGPLAEARVTLLQEGREVVTQTTGTGGAFVFDRLNPGVYRLQATLAPFLPAIEDVELGDGDTELVLHLGPLSEARVTLLQEGREVVSLTTSTGCDFIFARLNPSVYRLQATLAP